MVKRKVSFFKVADMINHAMMGDGRMHHACMAPAQQLRRRTPHEKLRTFLNSDAAMSNMLRCMLVGGLKLPQRTRTTL